MVLLDLWKNPRSGKGDLSLGMSWNHPWFHYLAGLVCLSLDRQKEAIGFLKESQAAPSLFARSHFFLGLSYLGLSSGGQEVAGENFEIMLVEGIKKHPQPWTPKFLTRLEKTVVEKIRASVDSGDARFSLSLDLARFLGCA